MTNDKPQINLWKLYAPNGQTIYAITPQLCADICKKEKWILLSPDGRTWTGSSPQHCVELEKEETDIE